MNVRASIWLVVLPLLVAAACGRQLAPLTEQEKHDVSELTQTLKSRCVGRYVIDMPADVLVSGGAKIQGVKIDSEPMSREAYLRDVANRQATLRGAKSIDTYPLLYEDKEIDDNGTQLFISRSSGSGTAYRQIEAYKWDNGYRLKLSIEGRDFLHPDQANFPSVKALSVKNDVPEKTRLVLDLVKRLRWRAEDDIPAEPGFCFLGAFLPGKPVKDEYAWAQFVLAGNRDVSVGIDSNSGIRETNTLLQRGDEINADLKSIGGRTVRKGAVALQGISAEEWIFAGKTDSGVQGTTCLLEANSMTSSLQSPLLTLNLETGSPNAFMQDWIQAASMSESEAIALWDVVSRTLRPRPNGF